MEKQEESTTNILPPLQCRKEETIPGTGCTVSLPSRPYTAPGRSLAVGQPSAGAFHVVQKEVRCPGLATQNIKTAPNEAVQSGWNYTKHGDDWKNINCAEGQRQSPVDIVTSQVSHVTLTLPIVFKNYDRWTQVKVQVVPQHYTVRVIPLTEPEMVISGGGLPGEYKFDHMHFHWPSEHTIDRQRGIMEAHFVHRKTSYKENKYAINDPEGIAVLGVIYMELWLGSGNLDLMKIESAAKKGSEISLNFNDILPSKTKEFYRYYGSLTTPTCNECVVWTVFKNYVNATRHQVDSLRRVFPMELQTVDNYRKTQPLNERVIEFYSEEDENLELLLEKPSKFEP